MPEIRCPVIPDLASGTDASTPDLKFAIALFGIPVFQEGTAPRMATAHVDATGIFSIDLEPLFGSLGLSPIDLLSL